MYSYMKGVDISMQNLGAVILVIVGRRLLTLGKT